jgi:hypothetical protein
LLQIPLKSHEELREISQDLFTKVKVFHKGNAGAFAAGVAWVYCSMNRTELQEEGIKFPTFMLYGIGESGKK